MATDSRRPSKPISVSHTIRVTPEEFRCLRAVPVVLARPLSQVVQAAVVEAAHKLGFYAGVKRVSKTPPKVWPDLPDRNPDESNKDRTTIMFDPATAELLVLAAAHVGVGQHLFMLGATFRYLASLRAAADDNTKLARLALPSKFEP
jgi:hypothetical protein